jgi:hypothetical protein
MVAVGIAIIGVTFWSGEHILRMIFTDRWSIFSAVSFLQVASIYFFFLIVNGLL